MKIYKYKFVGTHLKRCGTKELNNICSNYCGNYYMFSKGLDLIKNIKYLNCVYLADGFYSLYELGEEELQKLEDKFGGEVSMKLYIYELNNGKIFKKQYETEVYGIENRLSDIYEFRVDNYVYRKLSLLNYGDNYLFSFKEYKI